jgi:hypothetical protein
VDTYFNRAIIENREEILDLNVAQLKQGKDSLGRFLEEYASEDYAQFKQAMGSQAPFGVADLILEGDFTEGFVLRKEGREFRFDSTDEKRDKLVQMYGEEIFGLSAESQVNITPDLAESFLKHFRNGLL